MNVSHLKQSLTHSKHYVNVIITVNLLLGPLDSQACLQLCPVSVEPLISR